MEEDILNYSPTVMFRGTPCIDHWLKWFGIEWNKITVAGNHEYKDTDNLYINSLQSSVKSYPLRVTMTMYIVLCHISKSLHSEKKMCDSSQCVWSVHLYSLYYMWTRAVASAHKCSQWTLRSREYKFNRWALFNRFSGLTSFILRTLL